MIIAQEFAGIPIELPAWTQYAAWTIAALIAILIGVLIWRGILNSRKNTLLGEIHAKSNLSLLILRGFQERDEQNQGYYEQLGNEHYSPEDRTYAPQSVTFSEMPDPQLFSGANRGDDTDNHGRLIK